MATNLIAQLMNGFRGDALDGVASAIGETPTTVQIALGGALPALMGGIARRTTSADDAGALVDLIRKNRLDSGSYPDMSSAMTTPGGVNGLMDTGRPLLSAIFGMRLGPVIDWLASHSGMSRTSSSGLLAIAMPLVLNQIARAVGGGLNASSLMQFFAGQRGLVHDAAPPGLADALGVSEPARPARPVEARPIDAHPVEARSTEPRYSDIRRPVEVHETRTERRGSWTWVLPLLLLIPLMGWLFTGRQEPRQAVVIDTQPRPADPARPATRPEPSAVGTTFSPAAPGAMVERRLPNDLAIRVPANGVESRLLAFIEDPGQRADTETWFSFDRLEFESNSATLSPASSEQIRNIAEILRAYPDVDVKIGGYTDSTGDDAVNLQLSRDRATNTMRAIAGQGVDPSRLEAEGYGEAHPIADNDTAEGRQRNRRIDIRVTSK